jgi:diaminopimelate epimerase
VKPGIAVVKGHAYGNDFLMVPESECAGRPPERLAQAMCDRHKGIGADGLMVYTIGPSSIRMRLFNADGSESEVSGNGVRCLAALAIRQRPGTTTVTVDTPAGPKVLELQSQSENGLRFRAAMGMPRDIQTVELTAGSETLQVVTLSVGNPQCVLLSDALLESRLTEIGPLIERHPLFPNRTNVSLVKVESRDRVRMLIWERGVGPTSASGTGACGAAVAAATYGGASRDVEVHSPGGSQRVEWREDGLYLTGSATLVLEGRWIG